MTEEEAKTKWCPAARLGSTTTGLGGFNRFIDPVGLGSEDRVRCIGSACMAWRWSEAPVPARFEESENGTDKPRVRIQPPTVDDWSPIKAGKDRPDKAGGPPWRWVLWRRKIAAIPGKGYCGLAGKP